MARASLSPGVLPGVYEPRVTTETVLRQIVRTHLDRFLAETAAATDGGARRRVRAGGASARAATMERSDTLPPLGARP